MKTIFTLILSGFFILSLAQDRTLPADEVVITTHQVAIKGKSIPYKATTGTQPVWDKEGKAIAALHFTYYERSDIRNRAVRPLFISFNGGPGSGSGSNFRKFHLVPDAARTSRVSMPMR